MKGWKVKKSLKMKWSRKINCFERCLVKFSDVVNTCVIWLASEFQRHDIGNGFFSSNFQRTALKADSKDIKMAKKKEERKSRSLLMRESCGSWLQNTLVMRLLALYINKLVFALSDSYQCISYTLALVDLIDIDFNSSSSNLY